MFSRGHFRTDLGGVKSGEDTGDASARSRRQIAEAWTRTTSFHVEVEQPRAVRADDRRRPGDDLGVAVLVPAQDVARLGTFDVGANCGGTAMVVVRSVQQPGRRS